MCKLDATNTYIAEWHVYMTSVSTHKCAASAPITLVADFDMYIHCTSAQRLSLQQQNESDAVPLHNGKANKQACAGTEVDFGVTQMHVADLLMMALTKLRTC